MSTPECDAVGCSNAGKYHCKRCKVAHYCSSNCQKLSWPSHKLLCTGKLEQAYQFDHSYDRTVSHKKWLRSEMQKGPEQPMDPPEEYDYYWPWWHDRELTLEGKVAVTSSFLPPALKELIRKGLRNRDITWAYLFSDNFLRTATYSWVPLQYVLEALEFTVLPAEVKPSLQGLTEVIVEHFWRVIGLPGQGDYDPAVAAMLKRHGVTLPFAYSHCYEDEFRLWTHRMRAPYGPCACWGCQVGPYQAAREREAWEGLRKRAAKQGQFMMSWAAKEEMEAQLPGDGHQLGKEEHDGKEDGGAGLPRGGKGQAPQVQASSKEVPTALAWTHAGDERANLRTNLTRKELAEVTQLIDAANKQQRLPTNAEMNLIMAKVSVSKATYLQQTRSDVARSVAAAQGAQKLGGNSKSAPAKVPAGTANAVEKCAAELSSVHLQAVAQQQQGSEDEGKNVSNSGSDDVPRATIAACRPPRRAARKAVCYAEAAGSSDDSHLSQAGPQRRRSSDSKKSAQKGAGPEEEDGSASDSTEGWSGSEEGGSSSIDTHSSASSDLATEESVGNGEASAEDGDRCHSRRRPRRRQQAQSRSTGSKSSTGAGGTRCIWNAEMDARLKEGVALYKEKEGWRRVAEHVGGGVEWKQCHARWSMHLVHQDKGLRVADWTQEETARLEELVADQKQAAPEKKVDWKPIAQALGRMPRDCKNKHDQVLASRMKKGPFSSEEDALIRRRVQEWGDKGNGLWRALQEEMGRRDSIIQRRWKDTLSKK